MFKVGTDGVLLGAWVSLPATGKVLDVGVGTGLIALMIVQRQSGLNVEGIDLNESAVALAKKNGDRTPWANRLDFQHIDFKETKGDYDLVVSNPPFFSAGNPTEKLNMSHARHQVALGIEMLSKKAYELTGDGGEMALVLPMDEWKRQRPTILAPGWFVHRETAVCPKPSREANRVLLQFGKAHSEIAYSEMAIRDNKGDYSPEYQAITGEFYLDF